MALHGIDVSNWKDVDVTKARDFVIVQTTWGVGGFNNVNLVNGVSTIADKQYQSARAAGKRRAFMHYYMGNDVNAEADFFLNHNRGYVGDGIPMIDWEAQDNGAFGNTGVFDALLTAFEQRLGGPGIAYFQASEYGALKPICDAHNWGAFVAQYADMNPTGVQEHPWNEGAYQCALRQYSATGDIGAGDYVDLDIFYGDAAAWDAYVAGSTGGHAPAPQPAPQPAPAPAPAPSGQTYTVQAGDTLSGIAAAFGVGIGQISGYSSGNPDLIYPGEVLTINGGSAPAPAPAPAARTYTVQPGDTLSGIAAANGWGGDYMGLAARNGIANPDLIYPGQVINL